MVGAPASATDALTVLQTAKFGPNRYNAETADRALQIHSIAQSSKGQKLGVGFARLVSDVVGGLAFALSCTPQPDQSCMLSLLSTLCTIKSFAKKRLSQNGLRRLWSRRPDQRRIAGYRDVFRQQLVIFGLKLDLTIEENLSVQTRIAQGQTNSGNSFSGWGRAAGGDSGRLERGGSGYAAQDQAHIAPHDPVGPGMQRSAPTPPLTLPRRQLQSSSDKYHDGPDHEADNAHTLLPDPHLSRYSLTTGVSRADPVQQPLESSSSTATGSPHAMTDPPSSSSPQSALLGSPAIIFFIEHFHADFTNHTANHNSGNMTTTTVANSANDSSRRSA